MQLETFILRGLFVASVLMCGLILSAMLSIKATPVHLASTASIATLLTSAPATCALPLVDDVICVRAG